MEFQQLSTFKIYNPVLWSHRELHATSGSSAQWMLYDQEMAFVAWSAGLTTTVWAGRGAGSKSCPGVHCVSTAGCCQNTVTFPLSVLIWSPVMTNLIPILATKGVQTDSYVQNHVIWQLMGTSSCACNPLCVKEIIAAGFGTVQRPQTKQPFYRWVDGVNSDIQVWRQSKEVGLYCLGWGKKTLWLQQSQDFWG